MEVLMEAVPRLSEYGYHQAGWSEAALPVMEVALIFTLTMFAWETYLHLRQHSRLERKGGVIPAKLKELVQVVDAQALAKKKSGVVEPLAKAHCVVGPDGKPSEGKAAKAANCNGTVSFAMSEDEAECTISWELEGLKEGKHSLYVHEKADFSSGYKSTGSQYNPHGKATDGSAEKEEDKPVGDLGKDVVVAGKDGKASGSVKSKAVKLNGAVSVLGRSVLVAKVGAGNIAGGAIKAGEHGKIEDGKALEAMEKDVPKFQLYNLDKSSFGLVKSVFDLSLEIAFVVMGMYPFFWDISAWVVGEGFLGKDPAEAEALVSLVLLGLVVLQDTVVSIPWSLYSNFVVEEKHGFNKMTLTLFVTDLLTTLALTAAIGGPITWLLIRLIKWGGEYFYVYCWAFMFLFSIVMMTIFPLYIQPLFNKYVELPEGELKAAIYGLAKRLNFPLTKLYQVDGSKRSSHSNAYLFGFGQNKRIVLFDTLVKQMTVPELEAVLGHEIGHWAHGHVLQMFAVQQVYFFAMFFGYGLCKSWAPMFSSFGFNPESGMPTLIGLLLFTSTIWAPVDKVISFLLTLNTRRNEFQADRYSVKQKFGEELKRGLVKMSIENRSNLDPDPLFSLYHYSHPPLMQRLGAIDVAAKKTK